MNQFKSRHRNWYTKFETLVISAICWSISTCKNFLFIFTSWIQWQSRPRKGRKKKKMMWAIFILDFCWLLCMKSDRGEEDLKGIRSRWILWKEGDKWGKSLIALFSGLMFIVSGTMAVSDFLWCSYCWCCSCWSCCRCCVA